MWMGGPHKFEFYCLKKDIEDTHGVASSNRQVGQTAQVRGDKLEAWCSFVGGGLWSASMVCMLSVQHPDQ